MDPVVAQELASLHAVFCSVRKRSPAGEPAFLGAYAIGLYPMLKRRNVKVGNVLSHDEYNEIVRYVIAYGEAQNN